MSSSPSPVLSAKQRAWQYWFDDGLPTLVAGAGCLLAAIFFANDHSDRSTPVTIAICFAALLLYCSVLIFNRQIIDWLKSRITYPRAGYAQPPYFAEEASKSIDTLSLSRAIAHAERPQNVERLHDYTKRELLFECVVLGAPALAMLFIQNRWVCGLAGAVTALALWIWGRKIKRFSWIVLGLLPVVGLGAAMFQPEHAVGVNRLIFFLGGVGAVLILDGAFSLFRYLRANPRPKQP